MSGILPPDAAASVISHRQRPESPRGRSPPDHDASPRRPGRVLAKGPPGRLRHGLSPGADSGLNLAQPAAAALPAAASSAVLGRACPFAPVPGPPFSGKTVWAVMTAWPWLLCAAPSSAPNLPWTGCASWSATPASKACWSAWIRPAAALRPRRKFTQPWPDWPKKSPWS